jgi:hypothetical protein
MFQLSFCELLLFSILNVTVLEGNWHELTDVIKIESQFDDRTVSIAIAGIVRLDSEKEDQITKYYSARSPRNKQSVVK